jgi:tricorn protease-like protein
MEQKTSPSAHLQQIRGVNLDS